MSGINETRGRLHRNALKHAIYSGAEKLMSKRKPPSPRKLELDEVRNKLLKRGSNGQS